MFRQEDEEPIWEDTICKLVEKMSDTQSKQTITYSQLSDWAGVTLNSSSYPLRAALKRLEEQRVVFINVPNVGYRRADDITIASTVSKKQVLKVHRAAKRGMRRASAAEDEKLPPQLRVTHWARLTALSSLVSASHGNSVRALKKDAPSLLKEEQRRRAKEIKAET